MCITGTRQHAARREEWKRGGIALLVEFKYGADNDYETRGSKHENGHGINSPHTCTRDDRDTVLGGAARTGCTRRENYIRMKGEKKNVAESPSRGKRFAKMPRSRRARSSQLSRTRESNYEPGSPREKRCPGNDDGFRGALSRL